MKLASALIATLLASTSFAGICASDVSLKLAEANSIRAQELFSVGEATQFDVLMASKSVHDAKLCIDSSDSSALIALISNAQARSSLVNAENGMGRLTTTDVALMKSEVIALKSVCATVLNTLSARVNGGDIPVRESNAVSAACSSLK